MRLDEKNEKFFEELAILYTEAEGEQLREEMKLLEQWNVVSSHFDKRIKRKIALLKILKSSYIAVPLTACLILAAIYFRSPGTGGNYSNSPTVSDNKVYDIEFVAAKLPLGYSVTDINYDNGKTVYHIVTDNHNRIILTVGSFIYNIENIGLREVDIDGHRADVLISEDFNFLAFNKDNIQYTLTDRFNYEDLIKLSKFLL